MLTTLLLLLFFPQPAKAVALPDTPQGKRVAAYIDAFNSGNEKTYLAMQEAQMGPDIVKRRTPEERSAMFKRLRGDFATMKVTKVVKATATEIQLVIPNNEGIDATFTFSFAAEKPYYISGIGVEVDTGGQ